MCQSALCLLVKGRVQTEFLPPCLPHVDISEDADDDYVITEGTPVMDSGSTFQGYNAEVNNPSDVAAVLDHSLYLDGVAAATHRIYAYRCKSDSGVIHENFDSDGDEGIGLALLCAMRDTDVKNRLWFVTRTCKPDYQHLGKKRFEHAVATCKDAYDQLV